MSPNIGNVLLDWSHEAGEVASVTMDLEMDGGLLLGMEDIIIVSNTYLTSLR